MTLQKNTPKPEEIVLLTSQQVADLLQIRVESLGNQRAKNKSQIAFIRTGKTSVRYKQSDVLAFLAKNTVVQNP